MNLRHNDAAIVSGCTTHTWPLTAPVQNIQKTTPSAAINVKLTNDQIMAQSHHGNVPIPEMPSSAQEVKIFPDHTYRPDHGMVRASTTVTLTETSVPTPVSSVLSPIPGTSRMQQKRTPEVVVTNNTRRSDNIRRLIIAII